MERLLSSIFYPVISSLIIEYCGGSLVLNQYQIYYQDDLKENLVMNCSPFPIRKEKTLTELLRLYFDCKENISISHPSVLINGEEKFLLTKEGLSSKTSFLITTDWSFDYFLVRGRELVLFSYHDNFRGRVEKYWWDGEIFHLITSIDLYHHLRGGIICHDAEGDFIAALSYLNGGLYIIR